MANKADDVRIETTITEPKNGDEVECEFTIKGNGVSGDDVQIDLQCNRSTLLDRGVLIARPGSASPYPFQRTVTVCDPDRELPEGTAITIVCCQPKTGGGMQCHCITVYLKNSCGPCS